MSKLRVGQPAPSFELQRGDGSRFRLEDLRGQPAVIYFYPKSFTSGCTAQACNFRDAYPSLHDRNIAVVGISLDGAETQDRFAQVYRLPFQVLPDPDGVVARAYGVWEPLRSEDGSAGRIRRATFILDERGTVVGIQDPASPQSEVSEIYALLSGAPGLSDPTTSEDLEVDA